MAAKIKKNVIWLGLVSLFRDMSSEMSFPILPIFLYNVLGAPAIIIGLIDGIAESTASVLKTFSGYISDKIGKRKGLVLFGYSLSSLTQPIFAVSSIWQHVLGGRILDRVGKGIRDAPRDALVAAEGKKQVRGKYFGAMRALDTAGAVIGNILAFVVLLYFSMQFRVLFWFAFIPGIIAVLIIVFKVHDVKIPKKKRIVKLNFKGFSSQFKKLIAIITVFGIAHFSYSFYILRAQSLGIILLMIPIAYLVYNIFYAGFAYQAGEISDRIGRRQMLIMGYLLFSIVTFAFAYANSEVWVWFLFPLYGIFMAATNGVTRAYVSDLVPANRRGTALGLYHTAAGLAMLPAGIIAGTLWDTISIQAPFFFSGAVALFAAILLIILMKK